VGVLPGGRLTGLVVAGKPKTSGRKVLKDLGATGGAYCLEILWKKMEHCGRVSRGARRTYQIAK